MEIYLRVVELCLPAQSIQNDAANCLLWTIHVVLPPGDSSISAWKGKDIIAHFGSVTSNMYLWVNGKYVGYSEDSKLEAEFDLTSLPPTG
ncbi:MAG: sugar-binding domain-containing protein [Bacteroides stercoris]